MAKNQYSRSTGNSKQPNALTSLIERLTAQWHCEPETVYYKREELSELIAEEGLERTIKAVDGVIRDTERRDREFFPPISVIRAYLPPKQERKRHQCDLCDCGWVDAGRDYMDNPTVKRCPNFGRAA